MAAVVHLGFNEQKSLDAGAAEKTTRRGGWFRPFL
jgi:hypothetical protein